VVVLVGGSLESRVLLGRVPLRLVGCYRCRSCVRGNTESSAAPAVLIAAAVALAVSVTF